MTIEEIKRRREEQLDGEAMRMLAARHKALVDDLGKYGLSSTDYAMREWDECWVGSGYMVYVPGHKPIFARIQDGFAPAFSISYRTDGKLYDGWHDNFADALIASELKYRERWWQFWRPRRAGSAESARITVSDVECGGKLVVTEPSRSVSVSNVSADGGITITVGVLGTLIIMAVLISGCERSSPAPTAIAKIPAAMVSSQDIVVQKYYGIVRDYGVRFYVVLEAADGKRGQVEVVERVWRDVTVGQTWP